MPIFRACKNAKFPLQHPIIFGVFASPWTTLKTEKRKFASSWETKSVSGHLKIIQHCTQWHCNEKKSRRSVDSVFDKPRRGFDFSSYRNAKPGKWSEPIFARSQHARKIMTSVTGSLCKEDGSGSWLRLKEGGSRCSDSDSDIFIYHQANPHVHQQHVVAKTAYRNPGNFSKLINLVNWRFWHFISY